MQWFNLECDSLTESTQPSAISTRMPIGFAVDGKYRKRFNSSTGWVGESIKITFWKSNLDPTEHQDHADRGKIPECVAGAGIFSPGRQADNNKKR